MFPANHTSNIEEYLRYHMSINYLEIDDNMLIYGSRKTKFVNLEHFEDAHVGQSDWLGLCESKDCIMRFTVCLNE